VVQREHPHFEAHYLPQYRLRHASEKSLNNLKQLQLDDTLLTAITPQLIKAWVDKRLRAGKNPGTFNRSVTSLKAVLNHAVIEGWLTANPLARLAKLSEDQYARIRRSGLKKLDTRVSGKAVRQ